MATRLCTHGHGVFSLTGLAEVLEFASNEFMTECTFMQYRAMWHEMQPYNRLLKDVVHMAHAEIFL